jgi:hypothetical protein
MEFRYASSSPLAVALTVAPACDANCTADGYPRQVDRASGRARGRLRIQNMPFVLAAGTFGVNHGTSLFGPPIRFRLSENLPIAFARRTKSERAC